MWISETFLADLRANNAQDAYMDGLDVKIKNVEKEALFTELKLAVCVNSAAIILKLGIATTALVGGALLANGSIDLLIFFMFLMLVSRLYDPMQITLQNFAAIIATTVQCERLDEVLSHDIQTGSETLFSAFSIVFQDVTLFNQSVMDNIRIGKKVATDEEVMRASPQNFSNNYPFILIPKRTADKSRH